MRLWKQKKNMQNLLIFRRHQMGTIPWARFVHTISISGGFFFSFSHSISLPFHRDQFSIFAVFFLMDFFPFGSSSNARLYFSKRKKEIDLVRYYCRFWWGIFFLRKWCAFLLFNIQEKSIFSKTSIFHAHRFRTCSFTSHG